MYALLIHALGFMLVNQLMPDWVYEAEWLILSMWYGAFVVVDLVALACCRYWPVWFVLAASLAWSACLMIEVSMGSDLLQRHDTQVQWIIDAALMVVALMLYRDWRKENDPPN